MTKGALHFPVPSHQPGEMPEIHVVYYTMLFPSQVNYVVMVALKPAAYGTMI